MDVFRVTLAFLKFVALMCYTVLHAGTLVSGEVPGTPGQTPRPRRVAVCLTGELRYDARSMPGDFPLREAQYLQEQLNDTVGRHAASDLVYFGFLNPCGRDREAGWYYKKLDHADEMQAAGLHDRSLECRSDPRGFFFGRDGPLSGFMQTFRFAGLELHTGETVRPPKDLCAGQPDSAWQNGQVYPGVYEQMAQLKRCYALVQRFEETHSAKFDFIVRSRVDMPSSIWAPSTPLSRTQITVKYELPGLPEERVLDRFAIVPRGLGDFFFNGMLEEMEKCRQFNSVVAGEDVYTWRLKGSGLTTQEGTSGRYAEKEAHLEL